MPLASFILFFKLGQLSFPKHYPCHIYLVYYSIEIYLLINNPSTDPTLYYFMWTYTISVFRLMFLDMLSERIVGPYQATPFIITYYIYI